MIRSLRRFGAYLVGKSDEIQDLDLSDLLMAKVILDIHRTRTRKQFVCIPLAFLKPIHKLDRPNAIKATGARVEALTQHHERFLAAGRLSCADLAKVLPSISWIKAVRENDKSFLTYEGNGRLAALHAAFGLESELEVEVELYHFRRPKKIVRRLNRLRRMNGLL